jgi:thiosulfate sulfurtransferase
MNTFTRISVSQAHEIMASGDATVVDIRNASVFAQGHIAKAQNINEENIDAFLQKADKEQPLICYCYHGISSQQAAGFFESQGFKKVYSIDGGWEAWKEAYG